MSKKDIVTPYSVEGEIDYEKLLARFGADALTDDQIERFPDHPLLRRRVFYAGRDVDSYLDAAGKGTHHSIVTGIGPSGPMHLGHALVFYFARRLQEETGAYVYIPLSDDEKYWIKEQSLAETRTYLRENLRDILAVGFDPERTRIVVDTADADVIYPLATAFAKDVTHSTLTSVYGEPDTIGHGFYPAVQATHLLLPQLVHGPHPTLVPIAVDQDPHVRVCRDIAAKRRYDVEKPGALLMKFLSGLTGPGKMSSSSGPAITLTDDRETVREMVMEHAYSGGRSSVDAHRKHGGNPETDVAFRYLHTFFEPDDAKVEQLAHEYRTGELLSGELKEYVAERIADFLEDHQSRRPSDDELDDALSPYRLTTDERERALSRIGLGPGVRPVDVVTQD
jgi:tryptophanyl-tRNA synthetase